MPVTKEDIANRISELFIQNFNSISAYFGDVDLMHFQKTVRGGSIKPGRDEDEKLILHESNIKANESITDLVNTIYRFMYPSDTVHETVLELKDITLTSDVDPGIGGGVTFSFLIKTPSGGNVIAITDSLFDSLNQFIAFDKKRLVIDPKKAKQMLDTNIYELLPSITTRQQQINNFFSEYNILKPPSALDQNVIFDSDNDGLTDTIDRTGAEGYSSLYDISGQYGSLEDENKFITWLEQNEDDENVAKSLEWLYNDLKNNYFVQKETLADELDERPEYESKSSGYLKIRNFNQSVIIRNERGSDIGLIGDDPDNPAWLTNGFTITMWVRFLDRVGGGTLFNFGNPFRDEDPHGFSLETFILNKKDMLPSIANNHPIFNSNDAARFIRLAVREEDNTWRDSTTGWGMIAKRNPDEGRLPRYDYDMNAGKNGADSISLLTSTFVPINLSEWYFIVANYNPDIDEDTSYGMADMGPGELMLNRDPDFWRWKIARRGIAWGYSANSGRGAKCKVEIISRTELLRARGYKVPVVEIEEAVQTQMPVVGFTPEQLVEFDAQAQAMMDAIEAGEDAMDVLNQQMFGGIYADLEERMDISQGFDLGGMTFGAGLWDILSGTTPLTTGYMGAEGWVPGTAEEPEEEPIVTVEDPVLDLFAGLDLGIDISQGFDLGSFTFGSGFDWLGGTTPITTGYMGAQGWVSGTSESEEEEEDK